MGMIYTVLKIEACKISSGYHTFPNIWMWERWPTCSASSKTVQRYW